MNWQLIMALMSFLGFGLGGCAWFAPEQIHSADHIVGIWHHAGERGDLYVQFFEDGRVHHARDLESLENTRLMYGDYWFENGLLHHVDQFTLACMGPTAIYRVYRSPFGRLWFQRVEDPCDLRAGLLGAFSGRSEFVRIR